MQSTNYLFAKLLNEFSGVKVRYGVSVSVSNGHPEVNVLSYIPSSNADSNSPWSHKKLYATCAAPFKCCVYIHRL